VVARAKLALTFLSQAFAPEKITVAACHLVWRGYKFWIIGEEVYDVCDTLKRFLVAGLSTCERAAATASDCATVPTVKALGAVVIQTTRPKYTRVNPICASQQRL
jgi:hypothetical protein